eukprot:TRINITY_DN367_c1_g2_i1.p2 TRINITY_DN367_c1_g2~~TRINITY_DN367_c1_g2_i1.p2  ORF type:complete len:241 (+),score=77.20 TRINITY_DN367_c1_g2_i1:61-783(+)
MHHSSHVCIAALRRVEQQCGPQPAARDAALGALRAFVRYAGASAKHSDARRVDTASEAYRSRLGRCPAALEVLALCGFRPESSDGRWYVLPPESDGPSPYIVHAIEEAAANVARQAAAPKLSSPSGPPSSAADSLLPSGPPSAADSALDESFGRTPSQRLCPLTKRLPKVDAAAAAQGSLLAEHDTQAGAAAAISDCLRAGDAVSCGACGGIVSIDRYEHHLSRWCPATGGGAADSDSDG